MSDDFNVIGNTSRPKNETQFLYTRSCRCPVRDRGSVYQCWSCFSIPTRCLFSYWFL